MGIVVPGASWRELFRGNHPGKKKRQNRKKGTFLKSFDIVILFT
jgi:hypothetical protein